MLLNSLQNIKSVQVDTSVRWGNLYRIDTEKKLCLLLLTKHNTCQAVYCKKATHNTQCDPRALWHILYHYFGQVK